MYVKRLLLFFYLCTLRFLEKYINVCCVLKGLPSLSQSKINSLTALLFSLFLLFCIKSGHVFHLSLLNASHTVYRRGNFLFRTVPASRSNLSFSRLVPMLTISSANFPYVWVARNGPPVCCRCRALSRYQSYARDADIGRGRHISDRITAHSFLAAPFERLNVASKHFSHRKWLRFINIMIKIYYTENIINVVIQIDHAGRYCISWKNFLLISFYNLYSYEEILLSYKTLANMAIVLSHGCLSKTHRIFCLKNVVNMICIFYLPMYLSTYFQMPTSRISFSFYFQLF